MKEENRARKQLYNFNTARLGEVCSGWSLFLEQEERFTILTATTVALAAIASLHLSISIGHSELFKYGTLSELPPAPLPYGRATTANSKCFCMAPMVLLFFGLPLNYIPMQFLTPAPRALPACALCIDTLAHFSWRGAGHHTHAYS